jgi:hypothetical protein
MEALLTGVNTLVKRNNQSACSGTSHLPLQAVEN